MNNRYYEQKLYSRERYEYLQKLKKRKQKRKLMVTAFFSVVAAVVVLTVIAFKLFKDDDGEAIAVNTDNVVVSENEKTEVLQTSAPIEKPKKSSFSNIYYAEEDKEERYEAYAELHPELSKEDVVWQVNSYLDKDYFTVDAQADTSSPYVIVNKYYKVPDNYKPSNLTSADGIQMTAETAEAYKQMKSDAAKQGLSIRAVSGFRTVEYQRNLYNSYLAGDSQANVDRYSARPGYSEHHTGMAIDLFGSREGLREFVNTPESPWVYENAHKYGFIVRYWEDIERYTGYEDEPWHLRYLGIQVATDMHDKGIKCFEEYKVKYIDHTPPKTDN